MWGDIALKVLSLVGLVLTANLFTGRETRTRRSLREEAELLDKLPETLPERKTLEQYVSESVAAYVAAARDSRSPTSQLYRRRRWANVTWVVGAALLLVVGGAGIVLKSDVTGWDTAGVVAGWALVYAGVGWRKTILHRIDLRNEDRVEAAAEELEGSQPRSEAFSRPEEERL